MGMNGPYFSGNRSPRKDFVSSYVQKKVAAENRKLFVVNAQVKVGHPLPDGADPAAAGPIPA